MTKTYINKENRSKSLNYYYNSRRTMLMEKITCKCGKTINRGNLIQHSQSEVHKKLLKLKK